MTATTVDTRHSTTISNYRDKAVHSPKELEAEVAGALGLKGPAQEQLRLHRDSSNAVALLSDGKSDVMKGAIRCGSKQLSCKVRLDPSGRVTDTTVGNVQLPREVAADVTPKVVEALSNTKSPSNLHYLRKGDEIAVLSQSVQPDRSGEYFSHQLRVVAAARTDGGSVSESNGSVTMSVHKLEHQKATVGGHELLVTAGMRLKPYTPSTKSARFDVESA